MIPRKRPAWQAGEWRSILAQAVRDVDELWRLLALPPALLPGARAAARRFPLRLPRPYLERMRRGDPADPLLRQFLPLGEELREVAGFVTDPVGDGAALAAPGVLRKYRGRVLLITTGACPVHCRYCFRRHFPYAEQRLEVPVVGPEVEEVILSGGDPLSLSDARLAELVASLPPRVSVRFHSRMPVVLPQRIDAGFLAWVERESERGRRLVMVIHANHAREVDEAVEAALEALRLRGVTLLNQAVLLRGVNDEAAALAALSRRLFRTGVLPYYLHLLDPVAGAAHFQVGDERARTLMETLRTELPGYLVPRLVRESPGAPYKVPLS